MKPVADPPTLPPLAPCSNRSPYFQWDAETEANCAALCVARRGKAEEAMQLQNLHSLCATWVAVLLGGFYEGADGRWDRAGVRARLLEDPQGSALLAAIPPGYPQLSEEVGGPLGG